MTTQHFTADQCSKRISKCLDYVSIKISKVSALLKHGKPINQVSSYRAISVTINYNKIYEKMLLNIIENQLLMNNITNPNQYGFIPGSSTEHQLIDLFYNISRNFNYKDCKFVNIIFFDFKDAFNKVDHSLIIRHLASIGIQGSVLELFIDYFSNPPAVCSI